MLNVSEWKNIFAPKGDFLVAGEIIRRPAYAKTLHLVAEQGAEAFYQVK
jgi:gamma-glutamyltranspeptidase/glutathione hydrolase/leukotriene-C4 hydrolase